MTPVGKTIVMDFEFGDKVKDTITGFEGTVTGYTLFITGCAQYSVQPRIKTDGDFVEGRWIDEDRLELVEAVAKPHAVSRAGGETPPAVR